MSVVSLSPMATCLTSRVKLSSGYLMPLYGLGTWRSRAGEAQSAVKAAIANGYRAFDCAWTYENEQEIGDGVKEALALNPSITREDLFITTKIWNNQLYPEDLIECAKDSLRKLQCGYIDLLLIHWPIAFKKIPGNKFAENPDKTDRYYEWVDLEDSWRAMESLVDNGLVRSLGVSNHQPHQLDKLLSYAKHLPVTNQVEAHPYLNQREMREYCAQHHMTMTAYSPLGNVGRDPQETAQSALNDPLIQRLSQVHNRTPAQIILRWHVQHGHTVIPKSSSPERIKENAAVFDFSLNSEEMQQIDALGEGEKRHRFINPSFLPRMKKVFPE